MYLAGRMSGKDCVGYIVFQLLGATVGAGLLFWFMNSGIGYNFGGITSPVDNCSVNPTRSFGPAIFCPAAWGDFRIMVVGPVIGAVLVVVCWVAVAGKSKDILEQLNSRLQAWQETEALTDKCSI